MARPLRIEYPNAVYHVTSRGNAGNEIFSDDRDRINFLSVLGSVVKRCNWLCYAYCMMDDHYHLMVETPDANLSRGMRQLNGVYTQKYNRRREKSGHLFEGRYNAILIEKDKYLLELCRYVVLNPLRARLAVKPGDWKWSSYPATAGETGIPGCLFPDWILSAFSSKWRQAQEDYKKYVLDGIYKESPWSYLYGQIFLGDDGFIEKLKALLKDKEQIKEIPRSQRYVTRPSLAKMFNEKDPKAKRDNHIYAAHVKYGYTLKEIADHLGIHYTTVSKALAVKITTTKTPRREEGL